MSFGWVLFATNLLTWKISQMTTRKWIAILVLGCAVNGIWHSCVSIYKPRDLDYIPVDDYWNSVNGEVEIAMEYDLLDRYGSHKYAKMEKKHKVSLVFLTIQNSGDQEWYLYEDLVFKTNKGDTIFPLSLETSMESLVKPIKGQTGAGSETEVIDLSEGGWLWNTGKVVNIASKVASMAVFATDMQENYLENRVLAPGETEKGYLGLPVPLGTPLEISLREKL
jgi:hypothetical protein